MTRSANLWVQLLAASWWTGLAGQSADTLQHSRACSLSDCESAGADTWHEIQRAAEEHYDRSEACRFTTFVGYEYTDAPESNNLHRNVIFRNEQVTAMPISTYDTGRGNFPALWQMLRTQCLDAGNGCDVMSIPHNSNLSGGRMFRDPQNPLEASDRLAFEPVVEIVQHKGSSECRFDRARGLGLGTEDELCDFEQVVGDNLTMLGSVHGTVRTERARAVSIEDYGRRNMVRNALKDGLALAQRDGVNPFQFGFIGSTDTHSATPGGANEDGYAGHLGRRDAQFRNVQDHFFANPGGLAVVWAEENSRDAIFSGLRRRESYATSGTRPVVRFFAGQDMDPDLCNAPDKIELAYQQGVPMGGRLTADPHKSALRLLVSAQKDPGLGAHPGTDLQRIQIIKGWVDNTGKTHERVVDVAGTATHEASVDHNDCSIIGSGAADLCTVWQDPDFDPGQDAFYYARVLENPSCRWSTRQCQAAGVNPFSEECPAQAAAATELAQQAQQAEGDVFGKCCLDPATEPFYSPIIQERAWTSPIWIEAPSRATSRRISRTMNSRR